MNHKNHPNNTDESFELIKIHISEKWIETCREIAEIAEIKIDSLLSENDFQDDEEYLHAFRQVIAIMAIRANTTQS